MIKPREQQFTQSCLPVSLAMLCDVRMTTKQEGQLLLNGLKKKYQVYLVGMLVEFVEMYKSKLTVYAEYKPYKKYLSQEFKSNKNIKVKNTKVTTTMITKALKEGPILVYLDAKYLEYGYYADHMPHFILLEGVQGRQVTIVDPWEGVRRDIQLASLTKAIKSLKSQFKYSPIIITAK